VIDRVPVLGGSNAQRAVFAETLIEARRRAEASRRDRPAGPSCGRRLSFGHRPHRGRPAEIRKMRPRPRLRLRCTETVAESRTVAAPPRRRPRAPPLPAPVSRDAASVMGESAARPFEAP
jgi:hypothetical protein